jgi:hypothetical protein
LLPLVSAESVPTAVDPEPRITAERIPSLPSF